MLEGVGLYYPFIRIPNNEWLITSMLLWDKLAAIVPRGMEMPDDSAAGILHENKLLRYVNPKAFESVLNSEDFTRGFVSLCDHAEVRRFLQESNSQYGDRALSRLHVQKLGYEIAGYLCEQYGAIRAGLWLNCSVGISDLYMTYLAVKITDLWNSSPVTNLPRLERLMQVVESCATGARRRGELAGVMTEIETRLPSIPQRMSIKDAIDLREELAPAREDFSMSLAALRASLVRSGAHGGEHYAAMEYLHGMRSALDLYEKHARELGINVVSAVVRTVFSIPSAAAAAIAAGDRFGPVGTSAGALLIVYKLGETIHRAVREWQSTLRTNKYRYLVKLNERLTRE